MDTRDARVTYATGNTDRLAMNGPSGLIDRLATIAAEISEQGQTLRQTLDTLLGLEPEPITELKAKSIEGPPRVPSLYTAIEQLETQKIAVWKQIRRLQEFRAP